MNKPVLTIDPQKKHNRHSSLVESNKP